MSKNDIQYWDTKASTYDIHVKESKTAYKKIIKFLKEDLTNNMFLLDIGTGTGEIPLQIYNYVNKIDAIDFSQEMINLARNKADKSNISNINFILCDINEFSYDDNTFDSILISNVLHIADDPQKLLIKLKRVIKTNGIIIAPTFLHNENIVTKIISYILKRKGHPIKSKFDRNTIVSLFEENNFRIIKNIYIKNIMPISYVVASKII